MGILKLHLKRYNPAAPEDVIGMEVDAMMGDFRVFMNKHGFGISK